MALAGRAYNQAQKFGAEMLIPVAVTVARLLAQRRRVCAGDRLRPVAARADPSWSRAARATAGPTIENLARFEGRGVWYWASPIEARLCADQEVVLVGGGNSAGQAAVFLSGHARKVHMLVRGGGLGASMSRYLIDRIEATPNIELLFNTEVVGARRQRGRIAGAGALAQPPAPASADAVDDPQPVPVRRRRSRHRLARRLRRHGSTAAASSSPARSAAERRPRRRRAGTSVPGVFAVGDVRSGSVKRVGGAIGEGAQVVAALHGFLADATKPAL